ncbi:MAG TPA: hypothetical protein ENN25_07250 [Euryarchaeota archaeon]|nr:hypothetical protein [Euryarchaeota archaeon]
MENCIYCPKCDRSIPKDEMEERSKILREVFGNKSLEERKCPVCGTTMIDMDEVSKHRNKGD